MTASAPKATVLSLNNYAYLRGGSDRYFIDLNQLLASHGHRVIAFSTFSDRNILRDASLVTVPPVDLVRPRALDVIRFVYSRASATAMEQAIKTHNPDIAHLHIYYGQLTASVLEPLKQAGVPILQTLHEYKLVCPVSTLISRGRICEACEGHRFWKAIAHRCNRGSFARSTVSAIESYVSRAAGSVDKVDHFISVSEFQRAKLIELGIPDSKISTIHNFKDVSGIVPVSSAGSHVLYFGRLERIKGLFTLVEAMEKVKNVPLVIAGNGSAAAELASYIEERRLGNVHLVGFKSGGGLDELIRGSICTVTPSEWYETFGLALIESFAHGRPVIATRMGGMTEIVEDGVDGFLVPPGDVDALREKLQWMADHREQAVAMGIAGRRKVERHFNPDRHYEKVETLYRQYRA